LSSARELRELQADPVNLDDELASIDVVQPAASRERAEEIREESIYRKVKMLTARRLALGAGGHSPSSLPAGCWRALGLARNLRLERVDRSRPTGQVASTGSGATCRLASSGARPQQSVAAVATNLEVTDMRPSKAAVFVAALCRVLAAAPLFAQSSECRPFRALLQARPDLSPTGQGWSGQVRALLGDEAPLFGTLTYLSVVSTGSGQAGKELDLRWKIDFGVHGVMVTEADRGLLASVTGHEATRPRALSRAEGARPPCESLRRSRAEPHPTRRRFP
jgi:hypothetical protein